MMINNTCPECGKVLSLKAKRCGCGLKVTEVHVPTVADHCCQYQVKDKRCPLPGSVSPTIRGSTWYCCEHWRHYGDTKKCEEILLNAEINYEKIMEERIDWRRKLWLLDLKIIKKPEGIHHE